MEFRKVSAYRFSYCLFAYLYKKISSEVKFPLNIDYMVPTTSLFSCEIGDCVLKVREIFKPFLERVKLNHFPNISSEEILFECSKWYSETLLSLESFTFLKFIVVCSFLLELVVYYFHKECYYFTPSAPTCLSQVLLSSQVSFHFSPRTDFFTELKCFSNEILHNINNCFDNLPSTLAQEAKYIENNFMPLFFNNISKKSSDTSLIVSRCVLETKECKILKSESKECSKLDEFQTVSIENTGSTNKDFSRFIDFQHDKLRVTMEQMKRKYPTCDNEDDINSRESKVCTPTFQISRDSNSSKIPCVLPLCFQSYPELSSTYINESSIETNQQEDEFDFSTCIEPFDNDYNDVEEFNPSYSFKFDSTYLNGINFNSFQNKLNSSDSKLCPCCNSCCADILSDFINDFTETNYESD